MFFNQLDNLILVFSQKIDSIQQDALIVVQYNLYPIKYNFVSNIVGCKAHCHAVIISVFPASFQFSAA